MRHVDATLVLHFNSGEQIETTSEHPFYVEGKGFVKAGELGIGTSIVTRAGPSAKITSVEKKNASATVYNFHVEEFQTYFVGSGSNALWAHNSCLTRANHVYEIRHTVTGELYKYGIGSKIRPSGGSDRALRQIARLGPDYSHNIVAQNITREAARSMERGRVNAYSVARQRAGLSTGPVNPPGNIYPHAEM